MLQHLLTQVKFRNIRRLEQSHVRQFYFILCLVVSDNSNDAIMPVVPYR